MENKINIFEKGKKAVGALLGLTNYLKKSSIERKMLELVDFRVSQINNCAYCLDMHYKELRSLGETEQRIYSVSAWRETPYYDQRERAALEWAEAITKGEIDEHQYEKVKSSFSDEELIDLTVGITTINTWNKINLVFPQIPGTYQVGRFS